MRTGFSNPLGELALPGKKLQIIWRSLKEKSNKFLVLKFFPHISNLPGPLTPGESDFRTANNSANKIENILTCWSGAQGGQRFLYVKTHLRLKLNSELKMTFKFSSLRNKSLIYNLLSSIMHIKII